MVVRRWMVRLAAALLAWPITAMGVIPTPESHFGHRMGADRKLVEWDQVVGYYQRVARESDHVRVTELGKTTEGRPFLLVTVAAPDTLRNLDRYQEIQARLADPRKTTRAEAESLIAQGKTVVLITCSVHSTEVASTLTAIEFLHKLLTEDTRRHRRILEDTILLLIPSLNPDGIDKVAAWYNRYLGTPYEGAPMVELYHKYAGHDNNRDWYMFTQRETRLAVEKVHNVWRPQIVYDVHEMGWSGARMFLPPWVDPFDPNIDPLIVQQVNMMGAEMAVDLTAAGKKGVVINGIYDYFTPARHYQSYHHGLRLLSEAAGVRYASPVVVPFSSLQSQARGYSPRQPSWNFLEPWRGGEWTLRDIVDYQLITFQSCLYHAATHRDDLLRHFYRIGRRVMDRQSPWGFVIPRSQPDSDALVRLLETLRFGMVEIERARQDFRAGRRLVREGDFVIRMAQPYASFAKTLLERQDYPDLRQYPGGPPRRPYDVTAHTLPLLLGVEAYALDEPLEPALGPVEKIAPPAGAVAEANIVSLSPARSNSWKAVNRLLAANAEVFRDAGNGAFYVPRRGVAIALLPPLAREYGLDFSAVSLDLSLQPRLRTPRIGLYSGFVPIIDEGWTRWVLEEYGFTYETVANERLYRGDLHRDYDVIILPDATQQSLHSGYMAGALYRGVEAPPEYTGGIEEEGAEALRRFVIEGGAVLAFNGASSYAIEHLRLPARDVLANVGNERFYAPGTLLNAHVDPSHPLCFGMPPEQAVWFESGPAFEARRDEPAPPTLEPVTYPETEILASGWLLGERHLARRAAVIDVPLGRGHAVLFGIRPQYRGQSQATFKMVFNGLFYWEP